MYSQPPHKSISVPSCNKAQGWLGDVGNYYYIVGCGESIKQKRERVTFLSYHRKTTTPNTVNKEHFSLKMHILCDAKPNQDVLNCFF